MTDSALTAAPVDRLVRPTADQVKLAYECLRLLWVDIDRGGTSHGRDRTACLLEAAMDVFRSLDGAQERPKYTEEREMIIQTAWAGKDLGRNREDVWRRSNGYEC